MKKSLQTLPVKHHRRQDDPGEFTIRRLIESDLSNFRAIRLEALQHPPEAFGASYEEWHRKPDNFFTDRLRNHHIFGGFDAAARMQGMIGVSHNPSHTATL